MKNFTGQGLVVGGMVPESQGHVILIDLVAVKPHMLQGAKVDRNTGCFNVTDWKDVLEAMEDTMERWSASLGQMNPVLLIAAVWQLACTTSKVKLFCP